MSTFTRLASTDEQENSVAAVERAFKKVKLNIVGYTTIGKSPQTVILDIKHHGSEVYIDGDGRIKIGHEEFHRSDITEMSKEIKSIREAVVLTEA